MWTKEDNKKYRALIKEGKSIDEIKEIMGDRLKFNTKFISNFSNFIMEEISYSSKNTIYSLKFSQSTIDISKQNYQAHFSSNSGENYIIDFIYIKDNIGPYANKDCYNVSFTLLNNHSNDSDKYEQLTNKNELHDVLSRVLFIINEICDNYNISTLIVGLTKNEIKNRIYLEMINCMKKTFTLGKSSINNELNVYYITY